MLNYIESCVSCVCVESAICVCVNSVVLCLGAVSGCCVGVLCRHAVSGCFVSFVCVRACVRAG